MKALTRNPKVNSIVLIPLYSWIPFFLISLFIGIFSWKNASGLLFGLGAISVNLSWIVLLCKPLQYPNGKRAKREWVGIGLLLFSFYSFLFSTLLGLLVNLGS